ncbi:MULTISPECIES: winged helix-turn-helix domain-containing protein [Streptomyces]|uniref:winged helix-turn-helix domain-containing protein n=1 Tax=Streptomyces TaxID=1883 RepID=UPI0012E148BB|nr:MULTISPECIES: winged helix-turn-helix domain-containing protein [Streptomyces]
MHQTAGPPPDSAPLSPASVRRHLQAVSSGPPGDGELTAYLVLVPDRLPPDQVFAPHLTVRRVPVPAPAAAAPGTGRPEPGDAEGTGPGEAAEGLRVDAARHTARLDGAELDLTYLEFQLLAYLVEHPHRVHSRDRLLSRVWGYDHPGDGRTVDVHIARLRRKLGPAHRDHIVTVRRVGYKFVPLP